MDKKPRNYSPGTTPNEKMPVLQDARDYPQVIAQHWLVCFGGFPMQSTTCLMLRIRFTEEGLWNESCSLRRLSL
jgi:hypothetical protein